MKRFIFLLVLACCAGSVRAESEKTISYLPQVEVRNGQVVKENRDVRLSMTFDLSRMRIKTQHTVALTPVLIARDGSREYSFPMVVIDGRVRNKAYLRAQRLGGSELPAYHDDDAQTIIRRRNGSGQTYDYEALAPYERWMLGSRLELREEVHGCVNCGAGESERSLLGNLLPEFVPSYAVARIEPEPEPVKVRAETRTARLQFRQDSYKILPEFRNNRSELDTVSNSVRMVRNNADVTITGIYITGYASPEGTMAHNLTLSENRAKALADYIRRHDDIDATLLHVDWKGEDWDGFIRELGNYPQLLSREKIYALIERYPDDHDYCETQFRKLIPPEIYQRLINEVYPPLRRNEYRIEYNVRNFDLEEARRMLRSRPDLLSLTEMYKVADSYGKDSPEYAEAMRVAAEYYPDRPAVLNDRALGAIAAEEFGRAVELLKPAASEQHPALLNTLGVAYAGMGEYDEAETVLRRAAEAGSSEARHNLEELLKVVDQL